MTDKEEKKPEKQNVKPEEKAKIEKERDDFKKDMFRYKEEKNRLEQELKQAREQGRLLSEEEAEEVKTVKAAGKEAGKRLKQLERDRENLKTQMKKLSDHTTLLDAAHRAGASYPEDVARLLKEKIENETEGTKTVPELVEEFLSQRPEYVRAEKGRLRFGSGSGGSRLSSYADDSAVPIKTGGNGQTIAARMLSLRNA